MLMYAQQTKALVMTPFEEEYEVEAKKLGKYAKTVKAKTGCNG